MQSELHKGYPNANIAIDMASAVVYAIKSVCMITTESCRIRLALLTPYIDSVHQKNIDYLNENGIDVVIDHNLGFRADKQTTSMSPMSIYEHVKCLASICSDIDVFFVGCSAFRSTGIYYNNYQLNRLKIIVNTNWSYVNLHFLYFQGLDSLTILKKK